MECGHQVGFSRQRLSRRVMSCGGNMTLEPKTPCRGGGANKFTLGYNVDY